MSIKIWDKTNGEARPLVDSTILTINDDETGYNKTFSSSKIKRLLKSSKNLINDATNEVGFIYSDGTISTAENFQHTKLIEVTPNTDYQLYFNSLYGSGYSRVHAYDADDNWIEQLAYSGNTIGDNLISFTTKADTRYIKLSYLRKAQYAILTEGERNNYSDELAKAKVGYKEISSVIGKSIAFFGGSVCSEASTKGSFMSELLSITQADSITNYAIGGAGWVAGTTILTQLDNAHADGNYHDVYVFWSSTNDYTSQKPIGYVSDSANTTTVIGSMKAAVERVRTVNPKAKILFTTPIRCFTDANGYDSNAYPDGVIPFVRYSDAVQMVAEYYGYPVFDLWNCSGIDNFNYTNYMTDTVHPTSEGYLLFSKSLALFIANSHDASGNKTKKPSNIFHVVTDDDIANKDNFSTHTNKLCWKVIDGICYVYGAFNILNGDGGVFSTNFPVLSGDVMFQATGASRNTENNQRDICYGYMSNYNNYNNISDLKFYPSTSSPIGNGYRISFSYPVKY